MVFALPVVSMAVDVAPRISDREIVEKLVNLEAGQEAMNQRFDDLDASVSQRFDSVNQRFDDMNRSVNQRFDDVNRRISDLQSTMLALFSSMVALILALFAYIAWDRRTMLKPIADRLDRVEKNLTHDLELAHPDGSKITRLLKVLRDLAKHDEKVANALRSCSLL